MVPETRTTPGRQRQVGKVTATITITNRGDEVLSERGLFPPEQVRSLTIETALVDTGAMTLCLPEELVQRLGLPTLRMVVAETATGIVDLPLAQDAKLHIEDRSGTFECLVLPRGATPLLGVVPMEMLGVEPDLQNQRLRFLPMDRNKTYVLAPTPITH